MKKRLIYTVLLISVSLMFYYINQFLDKNFSGHAANTQEFLDQVQPSSNGGIIVHRRYYSFSYREDHEQSEWVMYSLTLDKVSTNKFIRPYFKRDPYVVTESADWRNYKNSGYERGHLCPAADMKFDYNAFQDTFYTSNIVPQTSRFNGGIWNRLEQKVRKFAIEKKELVVITGGVLGRGIKTIGYEAVSVPESYYKIILTKSEREEYEVMAFLIPQDYDSEDLVSYTTTIDNIEQLTGIDFLKDLDIQIQNQLESQVILKNWNLN